MRSVLTFALILTCCAAACPGQTATARWWVTRPDKSALLEEQTELEVTEEASDTSLPTIEIDPSKRYQSIDGFGFALTGGSAQVLMGMTQARRHALLEELFSRDEGGIGISYLRVSIGSSDLNARTFSYDDMPEGKTDPKLEHFSLSLDLDDVVPALKEVLEISPGIKILASPGRLRSG